jgi:hypothetical protein
MVERATAGLSGSLEYYKGCQSLIDEMRQRGKEGMEWVLDAEAPKFYEQSVPDTRILCKSFPISTIAILSASILLFFLSFSSVEIRRQTYVDSE